MTEAEYLLEERAAIISEGCGVSQREGMRRAREQARQERRAEPDRGRRPPPGL